MDDPHVKSSLVDDTDFLAKLRELDDGLGGDTPLPLRMRAERPAKSARTAHVRVAPPVTAGGDREPARPFPAFAPAPDPDPNPATSPASLDRPGGRRPLLDLFPALPVAPAPLAPIPGTAR